MPIIGVTVPEPTTIPPTTDNTTCKGETLKCSQILGLGVSVAWSSHSHFFAKPRVTAEAAVATAFTVLQNFPLFSNCD